MKKMMIVAALCVASVFAFVSCSKKEAAPAATSTETTVEESLEAAADATVDALEAAADAVTDAADAVSDAIAQ